jgi:hypothetical protein
LNSSITNQRTHGKGGTKLSGLFFCSKSGGTPDQESEDEIGRNEKCSGMQRGKIQNSANV